MELLKPEPAEFKPYFQRYLDLTGEGGFSSVFNKGTQVVTDVFKLVPADKEDYRYAPEKWTVKQLLQHVTDTDRVFAYRALVAGRMDTKTVLNVVDENHYADMAAVSHRNLSDMLAEFESHRSAFLKLLQNLTDEQSRFCALVDGYPASARSMGYVSIGHCIHHANILRERYL